MLIGEMKDVKKYYGERLVLKIENLRIYTGDRIGIVGMNGAGKSTMLNILTGRIIPEEGTAEIKGSFSYITQLEEEVGEGTDKVLAKRFGVNKLSGENASGGEIMRLKLAEGLSKNSSLIIADEPTSNLDAEGIKLLQGELKKFDGAILLVSHDRDFLDEICTDILEIENGKVKLFTGNYSQYKALKQQEIERASFEYEQYTKEKKRLEGAIQGIKEQSGSIRKTPSRMGNSEARLHKMGGQKAKASLDRAVKNLKSRIESLEVKERPKELPNANIGILISEKLHSRILFRGENINKYFGDRCIFNNAEFKVYNGTKTALCGLNGSGKTTLINMLVKGEWPIGKSRTVKPGYFNQDLSVLEQGKSLIENVMKDSIRDETFVRTLLARLLFTREDLNKKVQVLSGGERVKTALAKVIVGDFNMLILDEPTNYLDIYSIEAVEDALKEYDNTILFVSHDRRFVNTIADHIILIENNKLVMFEGNMEDYMNKSKGSSGEEEKAHRIMVLENRIAEVLGRLSVPTKKDNLEALDLEYKELVGKLKALKG